MENFRQQKCHEEIKKRGLGCTPNPAINNIKHLKTFSIPSCYAVEQHLEGNTAGDADQTIARYRAKGGSHG